MGGMPFSLPELRNEFEQSAEAIKKYSYPHTN